MVGQDTIHSGIVGFELRSGCSFGAAHLRLRTGVLFRDLPAQGAWGCRFLPMGGKYKKNCVPLFSGSVMVEIRGVGFVLAVWCRTLGRGNWTYGVGRPVEPYSAYGRMASNLLAPFYRWGNNLLAYMAERMDSYAFYEVEVWMKGLSVLGVALLTFGCTVRVGLANRHTYCNTICPVGTLLGFLSRYAWLKPVIDTSKCVNCNLCERNCKASCIHIKEHKIDYSRCVACMNCIDKCPKGAIRYVRPSAVVQVAPEKGGPDNGRRSFLAVASWLMAQFDRRGKESRRRVGRDRGEEDSGA